MDNSDTNKILDAISDEKRKNPDDSQETFWYLWPDVGIGAWYASNGVNGFRIIIKYDEFRYTYIYKHKREEFLTGWEIIERLSQFPPILKKLSKP